MKNSTMRWAVIFLFILCAFGAADAQLTPTGDSYTNTAAPTTN
jgi:hypothetical protein